MLPKNNRVATFIIKYLHVKGNHVTGTNNTLFKMLLRLNAFYRIVSQTSRCYICGESGKCVSGLVCVYLVHPVFTFAFVGGNSSL